MLPEGPYELLAAPQAAPSVADQDEGVGLLPDLACVELIDLLRSQLVGTPRCPTT